MDQARGEAPAQWRRVRRLLNEHRTALAATAAALYPDLPRVAGTDLLCRPGWLPATPLDLADVPLGWVSDPPPPAVQGTGADAAHVLPRPVTGQAYPTYAAAIEALDRPALFENRVCYRLLDADLGGPAGAGQPGLRFGPSRYFDAVNLGGAVGHELAAACAAAGNWAAPGNPATPGNWAAPGKSAAPGPDGPGGAPALADLPLRASVGDPCALPRRSALTAVTTLTLRRARNGTASFLLHWRDPARVNHAGGLFQVMPAGIFQPVSAAPAAQRHDLSLWRCMTREFSEELLGGSEEYPTREGRLDYGRWPFHRELAAARDAGTLRVSCLGLGVDPLTLATDILTVAVFEAAVFDRVFRGLVGENAEGRVVTQDGSAAIPFTRANVARFSSGEEPVQTAGEALLRLAWQHREFLGA
jgi:hypothetical protein